MIRNESEFFEKLDIRTSTQIKGVALILMVIHHCFGFPKWYVNGIDYSYISILGEGMDYWIRFSTKVCVSLYAFLTGYVYFFNKDQTLKYSIKKIYNFLLNYWIILFAIFIPISVKLGEYKPTINSVILNMFALKSDLVVFAWYVYFYIFAMIVIPFIVKRISGKFWLDTMLTIAICILFRNLLSHIEISREYLIKNLSNCIYWMQCVIIGYIFAKYKIFKFMYKYFYINNVLKSICVIIIVLGCRLKWREFIGINLDILYAPTIIFELIYLLNNYRSKILNNILMSIGRNSLNIWFLHSIFFSIYTKVYIQKIAYIPNNPILVVIWVIILCMPISIMINYLLNSVKKLMCKKK